MQLLACFNRSFVSRAYHHRANSSNIRQCTFRLIAERCEIRVLLRYRIIIERRRRQLLKKRKLNGAVMRSRRTSVYLLDSIYFATNFSSRSFHQIYSVQWPQSRNIKLISWWYIFVLVVQQKVSS